ncbi:MULTISPECIES: TetR/AcrR family transcriptional regulator [Actinokineospora]|uniref:TetR family transcriptional regulator n=2 Tax=Actinokineospora TaxID=39845 RepID=A0A421BBS4_9PSEU|nr:MULTISPECIES: TetR/AcrR family transcriptional regulator [Actinokineospora]RLK61824.1 TetR family transcriptional regulator [Actinokineospora cianjurensis]SES33391.1 transcriptional regulator, TetR family [Actinokineospora terrae]
MGRPRKFDPDRAVAQAAETFRVNGYAETSPQDLADSIGIGKGSLYNTFGSKHELFLRSLEHYAGVSLHELRAVLDTEGTIRDRIRAMLTGFVDADLADPDRCGCLVVNSAVEIGPHDEHAARLLGRSFDSSQAVLHTAFIAAQQAGEIAAEKDPKALACLMQSTMIGLRVLAKARVDRSRFDAAIDAAIMAI